ncbi:helix-turn-helix transcriptional regulator [Ornithinimicrobium tianjinense]|uniref:HTH luxR-type domain-containing protein n=1 Tax=Ornithinimicrobium tianjinense TaxID=1195761 RepID=A0A917F4N4_9MICO|nr:helix-turn-helix transcriptional regulator [Ornithinimicrobium tianjinense]GGF42503.1 hypothetical protein GCM10011366_07890 [Ornithinimicrobium tianjinense]
MTLLREHRPVALLAAPALAVVLLVVLSRVASGPVAGTRAPAVLAAVLTAVALVVAAAVGQGSVRWRGALTTLALLTLAYPGTWAVAVLTSGAAAGGWPERVAVSVATVAHLPLLAAFTLVPVLAVSHLGPGTRTRVAWVVVGLGVAAALSLVLFLADGEPIGLPALVPWGPGGVLGPVVNLVFLVVAVLAGPVVALLAAWRAPGHASRRLALVAAAALGGAVLVMVCGALAPAGTAGATLVLVAMDAALVTVALGCTYALVAPQREPSPADRAASPREETQPGPTYRDVVGEDLPAPDRLPTADGQPAPDHLLGGDHHPVLTPRESEVVSLLAEGLSNAGIAARLVLSQRTVDAHLRSAFVKLDLPDGPEHNRRVHAAVAWRSDVVPGAGAGAPHA